MTRCASALIHALLSLGPVVGLTYITGTYSTCKSLECLMLRAWLQIQPCLTSNHKVAK